MHCHISRTSAGRSHTVKTDNCSFKWAEELKYLGTTLTNQNSIHEEIKSRLMSGNTCYHLVQKLLTFSLLSKNKKMKAYRTIILPLVLCGYETWFLTFREEYRLRMLENRVLKRIFGPRRVEVTSGEPCTMRNLMIYASHQIFG